jgi:hypothetical protein
MGEQDGTSVSAVTATGVARFLHNNPCQLRKRRQETLPDPFRQVFTGRIVETLNVIEAIVIQLLKQRLKSLFEVGEIHDPARLFSHRAPDVDFYSKGMPMHTGAFMAVGHIGQPVGCLYLKYTKNIHAGIVPPVAGRSNQLMDSTGFESHP